jgi:hypothetical protein
METLYADGLVDAWLPPAIFSSLTYAEEGYATTIDWINTTYGNNFVIAADPPNIMSGIVYAKGGKPFGSLDMVHMITLFNYVYDRVIAGETIVYDRLMDMMFQRAYEQNLRMA